MITKAELVAILKAMRETATDEVALQAKELYKEWKADVAVKTGERLRYGEKLYRVRQPHTTQADYTPDVTDSLFEVINETNAGTVADPIPYDKSMAVFKDKYYTYEGVIYLCIRDSGNPLYTEPTALIGNYFETVTP